MLASKGEIIPVIRLGNLAEDEIQGYFAFTLDVKTASRLGRSKQSPPLLVLLREKNFSYFDSGIYLNPLAVLIERHEKALLGSFPRESNYVYIIPYTKAESFSYKGYTAAKQRVFSASGDDKVLMIGYIFKGKITWVGSPPRLDAQYATEVEMDDKTWLDVLRRSPFLRRVAEYGPRSFLTPQQMVSCDFIPPALVRNPAKIRYTNSSGEKIEIDTALLEDKITRKRRMQDPGYLGFKYTHGMSIYLLLKKFIEGEFREKTVFLPGRFDEPYMELSQELLSGYKLPSMLSAGEDILTLTDEDLQRIMAFQENVGIQKVPGINGWGAIAERDIRRAEIVGYYAGDVKDTPKDESTHHAFGLNEEDSIAWSYSLAVNSYHQGNFIGFVNHSLQANLSPMYYVYRGFIVVCFVAKEKISAGSPLFINYCSDFDQAHSNLSFTNSYGIVWDVSAKTMTDNVYEQGVAFFKAGKLAEAKGAFKQAVGLTANAPDENVQKATCQRSLGTTYFKLHESPNVKERNKYKYANRARFFLEAAQKHLNYAKDVEVEKKLTALNM